MNAVAIIPARGGSQRIPRKNIKPFLGMPIIGYSIAAANVSGLFDEVWVSTDDADIMREAFRLGAKVHPRAREMAEDGVGTQEVVRNALLELYPDRKPELTCCIYACAPTLWPSDLRAARRALDEKHSRQYVMVEGMFYFGRTEAFLNDVSLDGEGTATMDDCARWIDINTPSDWAEAELLYRRFDIGRAA